MITRDNWVDIFIEQGCTPLQCTDGDVVFIRGDRGITVDQTPFPMLFVFGCFNVQRGFFGKPKHVHPVGFSINPEDSRKWLNGESVGLRSYGATPEETAAVVLAIGRKWMQSLEEANKKYAEAKKAEKEGEEGE